jgi:hypothetical protein
MLSIGGIMSADRWILEAYERANEQGRIDMYMVYRELRDEFTDIDAAPLAPQVQKTPVAETVPLKVRWNVGGRFMKAFGS